MADEDDVLEPVLKIEDARKLTAVRVGGEAFAECFKIFGPSATLDFLLRAHGNWIIEEFIMMIPTMSTISLLIKKSHPWGEIDSVKLAKKLLKDPDYLKKQGIL